MIVNKNVILSTVEPHPLSFRAPMGMETKLNIAYFGQNGLPYGSDLGAQLQLTGRTSNRSSTHMVPATDIVNGRARAVIPEGAITDPNGYRLRLVGTLDGGPSLLAYGTLMPIAAAGLESVPEDIIDTIDLAFEYGENVELDITVWTDAGKGSEYDLTDEQTTITATVYTGKAGAQLVPFSVTPIDENQVRLSLTAEQVNTLPPLAWWSLIASTSAGATTLCEGTVTITGVATPPLVETTVNYEYLKPATGDINPVGGQIIHGTITQNMLKVAKTTGDLEDFTATLVLVRPGDTITIDVTAWTVIAAKEAAGWYEFMVSPVSQAAVDGVVPVTFARPA